MWAARRSCAIVINDTGKAVLDARQQQRSVIKPPSVHTSSNIFQTLVSIHYDPHAIGGHTPYW